MQGAKLYEDLIYQNLEVMECPKNKLKEKLKKLNGNINLKNEVLIIQSCETRYKIYRTQKAVGEESVSIHLSPAMRFRIELDILDLEQEMLRVDQALLQYSFDILTDSYCLVRYMNLNDNFMILDVYIGVVEKEKMSILYFRRNI